MRRLILYIVNRIIRDGETESNRGIERYLESTEVFVQQHIYRDDIVNVYYILGMNVLKFREDQVQCSEEGRRIIGLGIIQHQRSQDNTD